MKEISSGSPPPAFPLPTSSRGARENFKELWRLASKVPRQLDFPSTWPFPPTPLFFLPALSPPRLSYCKRLLSSALPQRHPQHFQCFLLLLFFLFQTSGPPNKSPSCLYICLCFCDTLSTSSALPACFSPWPACSAVWGDCGEGR